MDDRRVVDRLIDRLVRDARIPRRSAREELRRELATHFEEAGSSPEALERAMARFGSEALLVEQFRQVYRWDYTAMYLVKIAASVLISVVAALAVQVLVNLRVALTAEALRLAPGFSKAAVISVAVVVGLATAWEIGRRPFDRRRALLALGVYAAICLVAQVLFAIGLEAFGPATFLVAIGYACSRLDRTPARLLLMFCVFAALMYAGHLAGGVAFSPARALLASGALLAVWTSTVAILSRLDHAFLDAFNTAERR
jgi:hypothetical protein